MLLYAEKSLKDFIAPRDFKRMMEYSVSESEILSSEIIPHPRYRGDTVHLVMSVADALVQLILLKSHPMRDDNNAIDTDTVERVVKAEFDFQQLEWHWADPNPNWLRPKMWARYMKSVVGSLNKHVGKPEVAIVDKGDVFTYIVGEVFAILQVILYNAWSQVAYNSSGLLIPHLADIDKVLDYFMDTYTRRGKDFRVYLSPIYTQYALPGNILMSMQQLRIPIPHEYYRGYECLTLGTGGWASVSDDKQVWEEIETARNEYSYLPKTVLSALLGNHPEDPLRIDGEHDNDAHEPYDSDSDYSQGSMNESDSDLGSCVTVLDDGEDPIFGDRVGLTQT